MVVVNEQEEEGQGGAQPSGKSSHTASYLFALGENQIFKKCWQRVMCESQENLKGSDSKMKPRSQIPVSSESLYVDSRVSASR